MRLSLRAERGTSVIPKSGLISVVTTDIDKNVEDDFNIWYENHIREVVGVAGWARASRYRCLDGEPRYMAVYEIESRAHAAVGSFADWPRELQEIQEAGYDEFWPHIEGYRARNYELISHVTSADAVPRLGRNGGAQR
jgi:hypothetical protein